MYLWSQMVDLPMALPMGTSKITNPDGSRSHSFPFGSTLAGKLQKKVLGIGYNGDAFATS